MGFSSPQRNTQCMGTREHNPAPVSYLSMFACVIPPTIREFHKRIEEKKQQLLFAPPLPVSLCSTSQPVYLVNRKPATSVMFVVLPSSSFTTKIRSFRIYVCGSWLRLCASCSDTRKQILHCFPRDLERFDCCKWIRSERIQIQSFDIRFTASYELLLCFYFRSIDGNLRENNFFRKLLQKGISMVKCFKFVL